MDQALSRPADEPGSRRTRVRRLPDKQRHARPALDAVLDAGLLAHVGFTDPADGTPVVVPLAYARDGDRVLVHGSTGSRAMRALGAGAEACLTVTLLDGLIYARSVFESSMRYRSAMVLGTFQPVRGPGRVSALQALTEHLMPGRWQQARQPNRRELAATAVLALPLQEWSVKVSDGWPEDAEADLDLPVWAGVLPRVDRWGPPRDAPDLRAGREAHAATRPPTRGGRR